MDPRMNCFTSQVPRAAQRLQVSDLPFPDPSLSHLPEQRLRACQAKATNCNSAIHRLPLSSQELPWGEGRREVKGVARLCHSTASARRGRGWAGTALLPVALDSRAQPLGLHRASPGEPACAAGSAAESATASPRGQCGRAERSAGRGAGCRPAAGGGHGVGFPGPRWAMPPDSALRHGPSTCKLSPAHMLHIKARCSVPSCFTPHPPSSPPKGFL